MKGESNSVQANPIEAAKWEKPPIRLVDPDSGEKVRLNLRQMAFKKELSGLPKDMLKVHELLVAHRSERNTNTYAMVAAWNKLRVHDHYWTTFGYLSESDYLAYYGLPDGTTLAAWTVMVNLFDRPTFILLGDEVLSYMMRTIGEYQEDSEERKSDYQAIFDRYCDGHDYFDKPVFYDVIRRFVVQKYEEPRAQAEAVSLEEYRRKRQLDMRGTALRRSVVDVGVRGSGADGDGPRMEQDFSYKRELCPSCKEKLALIEAWQHYAEELETVIRKHLGRQKLPVKPKLIK